MTYTGFADAVDAEAKPIAGTAINTKALDATSAAVLPKRKFTFRLLDLFEQQIRRLPDHADDGITVTKW